MVALMENLLKGDVLLSDVARALSQTIAVFEDAGIDYCCKGARTLDDAAGSAGPDRSRRWCAVKRDCNAA